MRDSRLIAVTIERIRNHDYEALFAHGGCFHLALRVHERFQYPIRGLKEDHQTSTVNHVWCQRPHDRKAIDIRGVYPEDLTIKLANGGKAGNPYDVSVEEVHNKIAEKRYPRALDLCLFKLADWIIDTHERFEAVPPIDEKSRVSLLSDLAASSKHR